MSSRHQWKTGGEIKSSRVNKKHTDNLLQPCVTLSSVIEEMGNPFTDDSNDLLVLDTRDLADPAIIDIMREKTGQEQYDTFVTERLVPQNRDVKDPIKRNNGPLFQLSSSRGEI